MKIIGLVGGSGSGKGTVAAMFAKHNFAHVDTDAVYHSLTAGETPCTLALRDAFGDEVIREDGSLDRRALGAIVFQHEDREKLCLLNEITHRFVLDEVRKILQRLATSEYVAALVDAPLLFESGFDRECDNILCITAKKDVRIERIMERDGISRDMAEKRIASQISDEELVKRSDFTVENNGDLAELAYQVDALIPMLLK